MFKEKKMQLRYFFFILIISLSLNSRMSAQSNHIGSYKNSDSYLWLHFQQDVLLGNSKVSEIINARNEYWSTTRKINFGTALVKGGFWINLIAAVIYVNDNINININIYGGGGGGRRGSSNNNRSRGVFFGGVATSLIGLINRSTAKRKMKKIIRDYYPYGVGSLHYFDKEYITRELSLNGEGLSLKFYF